MKLLNKHNLAVRFAASKEKNRYTMCGILATENETVATDGHMMARVSLARSADPSTFPTVDGFTPNGFTRGIIPVEAAGRGDSGEQARIETNIHCGSFPTWDGSIWPDQTPVIDICFDAHLLASIATAAAKFSDKDRLPPIRLRFYSSTSAMRFDVVNDEQEMNGLLMPCRADVRSTFKERKISAPVPEPDPVVPDTYEYRMEIPCNRIQAFKSLQCWHYQCSEGDIDQNNLYQTMERVQGHLAEMIVTRLDAYDKIAWA